MVNDAAQNREELKQKLMEYSSKDRINRHINVEIAFAAERQSLKQLQEVIRRLTKENAGLRHDVKKFEKLFSEAKENKPKKMSREDYAKEKSFDKWGSMQEQSYADYLFSEAKDV